MPPSGPEQPLTPSSTAGRGFASCMNRLIEWPWLAWWAWLTGWHSPAPERRRHSHPWSAPGNNTILQQQGCAHRSPRHLANSAVPGKRLFCCWFGLGALQIALKRGRREGRKRYIIPQLYPERYSVCSSNIILEFSFCEAA